MAAFSASGRTCRAPAFPAVRAVGCHLVDYVVHSWDVARTLGLAYDPVPELRTAVLPVALAVPDGDFRLAPGTAFRPALKPGEGASPPARILTALGRSPDWRDASRDTEPAVRDASC